MAVVPVVELAGGTGVAIHRQQAPFGDGEMAPQRMLYPSQALLAAAIADLPRSEAPLVQSAGRWPSSTVLRSPVPLRPKGCYETLPRRLSGLERRSCRHAILARGRSRDAQSTPDGRWRRIHSGLAGRGRSSLRRFHDPRDSRAKARRKAGLRTQMASGQGRRL